MDSSGVKYSGGKIVPHSNLQAGTASEEFNRIPKIFRLGTWNVQRVARMKKDQNAFRIPTGRPNGKRFLDRPEEGAGRTILK